MLIIPALVLLSSVAWADEAFLNSLPYAKGNLKLGTARVHPGLEIKGIYDDNIYNRPRKVKSDYILAVTPALMVGVGNRHRLNIGYAIDFNAYADYSKEDFTAHHGKAALSLDFPGGLKVGLEDRYTSTQDPRPEELQLRASHWSNNAKARVGFEFPAEKLTLELSYALGYLEYDQERNKTINRKDDAMGASVYYRFLPKSSAFVNYEYAISDYYDTRGSIAPNSDSHAVNLGLRWDATAKLSGTVGSGWKWRDYFNSVDAAGNKYRDADLWTVAGALEFRMTTYAKLALNLNRSIEETVYPGTAKVSPGAHYVDTGGDLGVEFESMGVTVGVNAGYFSDEYDRLDAAKSVREDKRMKSSLELKYALTKWLSSGAGYSYSNTDSNDDDRDETHNKVFLKLSAML